MSDSDSELSATAPSDAELEKSLRNAVVRLQRDDPDVDLTVNVVRRAAATDLGLGADFFRSEEWKEKSKQIIQEQAERDEEPEEVVEKPKPKGKAKVTKPEAKKSAKTAGTKRKAENAGKIKEPNMRKKQKVSKEPEPESDEDESRQDSPEPAKTKSRKAKPSGNELSDEAESLTKSKLKKRKSEADSDEEFPEAESPRPTKDAKTFSVDRGGSSALSDVDSELPATSTVKPIAKDGDDASESEMSVLVDDSPPPKQRKQSASKDSKSASTEKKGKSKSSKQSAPVDPDQEEVKKLQGQLGQCGIRKVWGKYLKPYETSKAKIKHLKEMLAEAGMTGRFSQEKAKQIRDQRELAADLEAVTEGNKVWGSRRGKQEEQPAGPRTKRPMAKGLADLDFLSDGDGESD